MTQSKKSQPNKNQANKIQTNKSQANKNRAKTGAKKPVTKKSPAKKTVAKKSTAKKSTAKKPAAKKARSGKSKSPSISRLKAISIIGLKIILKVILIIWIITGIEVALIRFINPPFTAMTGWLHLESKINNKKYKPPVGYWRDLEELSPSLCKAVLAGEDQRFLSHHGFDFIEMNKAVKDIFKSGRVRGASTISMQVARTVFLWPERTWPRKLAEAYYTLLIEFMWDKERILEIYLNTVDWGSGIIGAEAATQRYFRTGSGSLTPHQAASLVAILPSPHRWSPANPNEQVKARTKRILKDMGKMPLL